MAGIFQDLRFALRMLAKNPGFTAVAVLTLALGMGANVSIFTLINGLILRPLPYPQTERVVQVDRQMKGGPYYGMSFMQFRLYQRQNRTFQHLAAYDLLGSGLSLNTGAEPELIQSRRVSADFFRAIGIAPAMGRDFDAADDRPGASPVVILSYRIWQDLLGGDSTAIGKSVRLGGENFAVIGVTPPNFTFSRAADAWVPLRTAEDPSDRASAFGVIGRLRSGVPYELAKQDLDGINEHIRKNYPAVIDPDEVAPAREVGPHLARVVDVAVEIRVEGAGRDRIQENPVVDVVRMRRSPDDPNIWDVYVSCRNYGLQPRVATVAICSGVVPNSFMCR